MPDNRNPAEQVEDAEPLVWLYFAGLNILSRSIRGTAVMKGKVGEITSKHADEMTKEFMARYGPKSGKE